MKAEIIEAFDAASDGYSSDRVVADPDLNQRFITECKLRGLKDSAENLNRALLNLRKAGGLTGRPRAKRTHFSDEDEYRFASEIAARFLERRDGISLDAIICNPDKVSEFDEVFYERKKQQDNKTGFNSRDYPFFISSNSSSPRHNRHNRANSCSPSSKR